MKRIGAMLLVITLLVMGLPMTVAFKGVLPQKTPKNGEGGYGADTVSLYIEADKKVLNLKTEDYLTGALFAEMNPTYEPEALKAQAVAAYTFYLYTTEAQKKSPDTALMGAYISDNPDHYQAYMKSAEAKEKFGDNYAAYLEKITAAVDSVKGIYLAYKDVPILASYHNCNKGTTKSAKEVWGKEYKYLQPVESAGDKLAPELEESQYGHGVGMSQYGADYMARQGASYEDILNHYYSGVTICT